MKTVLLSVAAWLWVAPERLVRWVGGLLRHCRDGLIDLGAYPGRSKRLIDVDELDAGIRAIESAEVKAQALRGALRRSRTLTAAIIFEFDALVEVMARSREVIQEARPPFVGDPAWLTPRRVRRERLEELLGDLSLEGAEQTSSALAR